MTLKLDSAHDVILTNGARLLVLGLCALESLRGVLTRALQLVGALLAEICKCAGVRILCSSEPLLQRARLCVQLLGIDCVALRDCVGNLAFEVRRSRGGSRLLLGARSSSVLQSGLQAGVLLRGTFELCLQREHSVRRKQGRTSSMASKVCRNHISAPIHRLRRCGPLPSPSSCVCTCHVWARGAPQN